MANWTDVARLMKALPGAARSGRREWRVKDKLDGWPAILIRLPEIPVRELRERLRRAWLERAPKKLVAGLERSKRAPGRRRGSRSGLTRDAS